jgi:hypothetical protein
MKKGAELNAATTAMTPKNPTAEGSGRRWRQARYKSQLVANA